MKLKASLLITALTSNARTTDAFSFSKNVNHQKLNTKLFGASSSSSSSDENPKSDKAFEIEMEKKVVQDVELSVERLVESLTSSTTSSSTTGSPLKTEIKYNTSTSTLFATSTMQLNVDDTSANTNVNENANAIGATKPNISSNINISNDDIEFEEEISQTLSSQLFVSSTMELDTIKYKRKADMSTSTQPSTSTVQSSLLSSTSIPPPKQYKPFTPLPAVQSKGGSYLDALSSSASDTASSNVEPSNTSSRKQITGYLNDLESKNTKAISGEMNSSGGSSYLNALESKNVNLKKAVTDEEKAKKEAEVNAFVEAKVKEEVEAKTAAQAEAKTKIMVEARVMEEVEAMAAAEEISKEEAEISAIVEAKEEAEAKATAEKKAKEEAEAKAKEAKAAIEAKAKEEAEAKAAEEKARKEAEAKAAEVRARKEAEAKAAIEAKEEAEAKAKEAEAAIEAKAKEEAKAKAAAEEKSRKEAEIKAAIEAKAKEEAEAKAAEEKARKEAEVKAKEEEKAKAAAEEKSRKEAEVKAVVEAKAREQEEKLVAQAKAKEEEQQKIAFQLAQLAREQKELAEEIAKEKERRRIEQKQAAKEAAAEAEAAIIVAATRKAKKDEENPEIDEIVAELSREVATDADEKIASWMRGNVEAADVVAALTKKAEAETKAKAVAKVILKARNVKQTLTDSPEVLSKQATGMWESFVAPKNTPSKSEPLVEEELVEMALDDNDTLDNSVTSAVTVEKVDVKDDHSASVFDSFFGGGTKKHDVTSTNKKEKVSVSSKKKEKTSIPAKEEHFEESAVMKDEAEVSEPTNVHKQSKSEYSIFGSFFGAPKPSTTDIKKEKEVEVASHVDVKPADDHIAAKSEPRPSVFDSIFGNSSPSKTVHAKKDETVHDSFQDEHEIIQEDDDDDMVIVSADPVSDAFASFFGTKSSNKKTKAKVHSIESSSIVEAETEPEPTPTKAKTSSPFFFAGEKSNSHKSNAQKKIDSKPVEEKPKEESPLTKTFNVFASKKSPKGNHHERVDPKPVEVEPEEESPLTKTFNVFASKKSPKGKVSGTFSLSSMEASKIQEEVALKLGNESKSTSKTGTRVIAKAQNKNRSMNFFGNAKTKAQQRSTVIEKEFEPMPPPAPKRNGVSFFKDAKRTATPKSSSATRAIMSTRSISPSRSSATRVVTEPKHKKQKHQSRKSETRPGKTFVVAKANKTFRSNGIKDDGIPLLTEWRQNRDGTITGCISNSRVFRAGQKIVTSPIKKGVKRGVVTTNSGSKYRLM